MYESPIKIIQKQMKNQMDEVIFKAVQGVEIDVNKEELIKALAYDREQYVKGYKDGAKEFAAKLKCGVSITSGVITCADIDDLLAEMVGGENA